jgi:membrane-bound lytic murein transglycosylase F
MKLKLTYKKGIAFFFVLFFSVVVFVLWNEIRNSGKKNNDLSNLMNDFSRIKKTGVLKAAVDYNSSNYFIYRGKPMGFEYELLQSLCNDLEVKLEIVVTNNIRESFDGLKSNRFDLIAQNLTITKQRTTEIDFTTPIEQTHQVLVQREKSDKADDLKYINSVLELPNKKIHVQKNSAHYQRIINLSEEIGGNIDVIVDSVLAVEELIAKVAKGEIDYTICDENIGKLNKFYYPNLDVSLQISFPQNISWAVRKGSSEWKAYLDKWITEFKETRKYHHIYYKYFESPRIIERMTSEFNSISGGRISKYDGMIKEIAKEYNWDWRLISAIIYHESRFNENAGAWTGAYGLMQIMPATAEAFGVENIENPKQNVKGGILLLNSLNNQFIKNIPDSTERVKFVLAAYNIGLGHVNDAQRLAKKYGLNPLVWENNVEIYLQNKAEEKYFKDEVVRWGYCRGEEATNFVRNVTNNYNQYLNIIEL